MFFEVGDRRSAAQEYQKFTAATVQAAPVYLNSKATAEKACEIIKEAASQGAQLIAFPEVFISGYAYWSWFMSPLRGSSWFKRFFLSSVFADGPEVQLVQRAAERYKVNVVIGINERSPNSMGTVYNTNLTIGVDGKLLNRHRKLVPTFAEKVVWGSGDGRGIRAVKTSIGRLGSLACGENTNTLARFSLLAQGEQVHVMNYMAYPFVKSYDTTIGMKIRGAAHSFEGKVFTLVSTSAMSDEIVDALGTTAEYRDLLTGTPNAFSGIYGPDGQLRSAGITDREGIDYAEIDLNECIELKQFHDILGHYNQFNVFELRLNGRIMNPSYEIDVDQQVPMRSLGADRVVGLESGTMPSASE